MVGAMISFVCATCGEKLEFRKRVTMTVRRCPKCNSKINVDEIDRQLHHQNMQEIDAFVYAVWTIAGICLLLLVLAIFCN